MTSIKFYKLNKSLSLFYFHGNRPRIFPKESQGPPVFEKRFYTSKEECTKNSLIEKDHLSTLTDRHRSLLSSIIRVNQAGELAANAIYEGQLSVFKDNSYLKSKIEHMWEQEIVHLNYFNLNIPKYGARPSLFVPVWRLFGYSLGKITALMGKEAAMTCTEAVETAVGNHYKHQLEKIDKLQKELNTQYNIGNDESKIDLSELRDSVEKFRDEELEHLNIAVENDAKKAPFYSILSKVIEKGCEGAIWIAKKI